MTLYLTAGLFGGYVIYTMIEMAKANDLNTYKYLAYLLSQRPNDQMSDKQLEQIAHGARLRKRTAKTKIE